MSIKLGGFSIPTLSTTNYEPWRKTVTAYFQLADLDKFLSGTAVVTDYASELEYTAKANNARSTLVLCIGHEMLAQVHDIDSAKDIWDRLENYFRPKGFGANLSYFGAFLTKKFVPGKHAGQTWCSEIDSEVVRLKSLGITVSDFLIVFVLLNGLGKDWQVFTTTLDTTDKNATKPDFVKRRIINEWAARASRATPADEDDDDEHREREEAYASAANHLRHRAPPAATPASASGRRAPARPSSGPPRRSTGATADCHRCGLVGHIAAHCDIRLFGDRYMTDDEAASVQGHAHAANNAPPARIEEEFEESYTF